MPDRLARAVIAGGMIVLESSRKVVQQQNDGTVKDLLARDGDQVQAGEVLLRLDDAQLCSELSVIDTQLVEVRARAARLVAEHDDAATVAFPKPLVEAATTDHSVFAQVKGQQTLSATRSARLDKEIEQIDERFLQAENQIDGVEAQLAALSLRES